MQFKRRSKRARRATPLSLWSPPGKPGAPVTRPSGDIPSEAPPARAGARVEGSIGCGIDVVELSRFRRAMTRGGRAFMRRIFTKEEEAYARARKRTTLLHLAGRFAAKEAVIKALSQIDPTRVPAMNQVEIRNDRLGRPHIILHDRSSETPKVHVSLSHVNSVAVASAIVIQR